jgi:hypothetical protein
MFSSKPVFFLGGLLASVGHSAPTSSEKRHAQFPQGFDNLIDPPVPFIQNPPPPLVIPCTPRNTVLNPSFDFLEPLYGWTESDGNATSFYTSADGQNAILLDSPVAAMFTLTGPIAQLVTISQSVETCPNSSYTMNAYATWQSTDTDGNIASNAAYSQCSITLSLGNVSRSFPLANVPNFSNATTGTNSAARFSGLYTLLSLGDTYTTGLQETAILLKVSVGCNGGGAFLATDAIPFSPIVYIDDVNMVPMSGSLAGISARSAPPLAPNTNSVSGRFTGVSGSRPPGSPPVGAPGGFRTNALTPPFGSGSLISPPVFVPPVFPPPPP